MTLTPRLPRFLALCAAVSLTPAFAGLVEFTGQAQIVGFSGPAPEYVYVEADRATHLSVTGVFDTAQPASATTENSATYTAVYAVGTIDGVEVPLVQATLTLRQDPAFESYDYLLLGSTADGRVFTLFGYSPEADFVPSLALPAQGAPRGEWYEKWDVDLIGPNWEWSCYSDGAEFASGPIDGPNTPAVAPPTIKRQPQSGVEVKNGPLHLRVQASGEGPMTYQWFKDGQPITGATKDKLHQNKVNAAAAGIYHVVVGNAGGQVQSRPSYVRVSR